MGSGRLREARIAAGLSQQAVADVARVHQKNVSEIERGLRQPTYEVARRLAHAVGREPEDLWETFGHSQPHDDDPLPRRLRLRRGYSQRQVSEGANVTLTVVRRAEAGERLTPANAKAIADFFGIQVADFQTLLPAVEETPDPSVEAAA